MTNCPVVLQSFSLSGGFTALVDLLNAGVTCSGFAHFSRSTTSSSWGTSSWTLLPSCCFTGGALRTWGGGPSWLDCLRGRGSLFPVAVGRPTLAISFLLRTGGLHSSWRCMIWFTWRCTLLPSERIVLTVNPEQDSTTAGTHLSPLPKLPGLNNLKGQLEMTSPPLSATLGFMLSRGECSLRFIRILHGISPVVECGVVRYGNRILDKRVCRSPSDLPSPCLITCTALSAGPLEGGWYGGEVLCWMLFFSTNSLNSLLLKQDPLSLTNTSGVPWVAKQVLGL